MAGPTQERACRQIIVEVDSRFRMPDGCKRRTQHRLTKVLEPQSTCSKGRQLVLLNIDEVIRIIIRAVRRAEGRADRAAFKLSDRQAEDILENPAAASLRRRLEAIKIEQELKDLAPSSRAKLEDILGRPGPRFKAQRSSKEIEADAKEGRTATIAAP